MTEEDPVAVIMGNATDICEKEKTSETEVSKEVEIDPKIDTISLNTSSEVEEIKQSQVSSEDTLLKELDEALNETNKSTEDPITSLLEEDKLLEENISTPENSQSEAKIDDIDLEIINEVGDQEKIETELKIDDVTEVKETNVVDESDKEQAKDPETETPAKKEITLEDKEVDTEKEQADDPENDTITVLSSDKQSEAEPILLDSDDEIDATKEDAEETVINKNLLSVSKRTSVDDDTEEPPCKRVKSDDEPSKTEEPAVENDEKKDDDLVVIDDVDVIDEKAEYEVENDLLVVAVENRRRSLTETEPNETTKRAASPMQDDDTSSESAKRTKLSIEGSPSSSVTQEDVENEVKSEVENEKGVIENGVTEEKEEEKSKTSPLVLETIELTPKPEESPQEVEEKNTPLSVEFLKSFKKSFQKMNRSDLEDFVLQKIVESIINKSEVSELRQKNETQEALIGNQRQRINDLAKQFRDLEMVHNRVVKDLETKSTGLITPVKITRAVGLQVSQPRPKSDFRPMYGQANQRVPPFPSRSPQRPNTLNAIQTAQRINMQLRQGVPQINSAAVQAQFGQNTKISPARPLGQMNQNTPAKILAMQKQQSLQRQQSLIQQQRVQAQVVQRPNSGVLNGPLRSPMQLASPGNQRSPNMLNQILNNQSRQPGSPVVLRKIVRPGPASVQQAQQQALLQQQKTAQNKYIDLTDEEDAARTPPNSAATKIHVKSPATLNSSIAGVPNGINRSINVVNSTKTTIQRIPGNQFVQIAPKVNQPTSPGQLIRRQVFSSVNQKRVHPAPLPIVTQNIHNASWKRPPPRPQIRIINESAGIIISWRIHEPRLAEDFDPIVKYQIYAYQETNAPPSTESWRHVGDVKAMALPMAVTLTQFQEGQRYHFAVRAVDIHERAGVFSVPRTWDDK